MAELRLIDANALNKKIKYAFPTEYGKSVYVQGIIDSMPTIESEPARIGVWVANTWCSACGRFPVDCSEPISNRELTKYFEYCPHCGAKMERGRE